MWSVDRHFSLQGNGSGVVRPATARAQMMDERTQTLAPQHTPPLSLSLSLSRKPVVASSSGPHGHTKPRWPCARIGWVLFLPKLPTLAAAAATVGCVWLYFTTTLSALTLPPSYIPHIHTDTNRRAHIHASTRHRLARFLPRRPVCSLCVAGGCVHRDTRDRWQCGHGLVCVGPSSRRAQQQQRQQQDRSNSRSRRKQRDRRPRAMRKRASERKHTRNAQNVATCRAPCCASVRGTPTITTPSLPPVPHPPVSAVRPQPHTVAMAEM